LFRSGGLSIFCAATQFWDRECTLQWRIDFNADVGKFPEGYADAEKVDFWKLLVAQALLPVWFLRCMAIRLRGN
jgi:hypothetical protein